MLKNHSTNCEGGFLVVPRNSGMWYYKNMTDPIPVNNEEALLAILSGENLKTPELVLNTTEYYLRKLVENKLAGTAKSMQVETMPVAGADEFGRIVQYIGETTSDYTRGYFYECVLPTDTTPDVSLNAPARLKAKVDEEVFASAVDDFAGEYEFDFVGKVTGFLATRNTVAIICLRNASIDTGNAIGWTYTPPAGGTAQNYYTDTEYITSSTKLYADTAFSMAMPYQIGSIDRSLDEGYWTFAGKETVADLATYGISVLDNKVEVGDAIIAKLDIEDNYYWDNIDVQPRS